MQNRSFLRDSRQRLGTVDQRRVEHEGGSHAYKYASTIWTWNPRVHRISAVFWRLLMHRIALVLTLALIAAPLVSQHHTDSRLLRFLKQQPEFQLITAEDVQPDGPWLVKGGRFHPLVIGDVRGRGTMSTLAVVIATRGGERHLGLVELHGERPEVAWVIEPRAFDLLSVSLRGTQVWPMICSDCDSGSFFRWNGKAWEFELWAPGDEAAVGFLDDPPVNLRRDATLSAPVLARIPTCRDERARILAVGSGVGRDRWYRVRVQIGGKPAEGFVRGQDLGNGQDCIG